MSDLIKGPHLESEGQPPRSPRVLLEGKTPEEWVAVFAAQGVKISARRLRKAARTTGECFSLGGKIILSPDQIDRIWFAEGKNQMLATHSKKISE